MDFKNNNEIKSYINDICDQVKNKRVHIKYWVYEFIPNKW